MRSHNSGGSLRPFSDAIPSVTHLWLLPTYTKAHFFRNQSIRGESDTYTPIKLHEPVQEIEIIFFKLILKQLARPFQPLPKLFCLFPLVHCVLYGICLLLARLIAHGDGVILISLFDVLRRLSVRVRGLFFRPWL